MDKEERQRFIEDVIQNGELFPVVINELMKLDTITKVLIYEHYMKYIPWENCGNYKATSFPGYENNNPVHRYSRRQKLNIANKGIDRIYENLKMYM